MNLEVNKRIRKIRKLSGYSQKQVAEMLGKKSSTYSQCEREGTITCGMLLKLAVILKVDVRTLLYDNVKDAIKPPIDTLKLTPQEENLIKIIRNLNSKRRKEVLRFIEDNYKDRRTLLMRNS